MRVHWADLAVVAALAAVGFGIVYAGLRRKFDKAAHGREEVLERKLTALAATVRTLEVRLAELSSPATAAEYGEGTIATIAATADSAESGADGKIAPEILVAIAAATAAVVGRGARVRSVRLMPEGRGGVSAWSQQGRAFVQGSHNLR